MARLSSSTFGFTGPLGNISAYTRRGSDAIIIRTKGGATKEQIETLPSFDLTRRINAEFGGRSTASKWIMRALWPQKQLADYNIAGAINKLLKPIQELDTTAMYGTRSIQLSKNPQVLQGFSLNHETLFESVIHTPVIGSISKEDRTAHVEIPELIPGFNFIAPSQYQMFSIQAVLGIVPDLFFSDHGYVPQAWGYQSPGPASEDTLWYPVVHGMPATTLDNIKLNIIPPDNAHTLVLSIGIRFGTIVSADAVDQVKHVGSAKVLTVV